MIPVFLKPKSEKEAVEELKSIDVDPGGIPLMAPKILGGGIKLKSISLKAAHILKQELLSLGGDVALPREAMNFTTQSVDIIIIGTLKQLRLLTKKLEQQPFGLQGLGEELSGYIEKYFRMPKALKGERFELNFDNGPLIMGILNVTPDSFYDGGRYLNPDDAIRRGIQLVEEGADIIDIGGESTRPGATSVSEEEELNRVLPVIEQLAKRINVPISIDTYKRRVAERAIDAGAQLVNDISGMSFDDSMVKFVSERKVPVVLMHIKGTPLTMQDNPFYEDCLNEVLDYFKEKIEFCLNNGISEDKIIIDPGIGFGKRLEDNLRLIKDLHAFKIFGRPILIGLSRKSFIGKILGLPPEERLEGSISATIYSVLNGANIVRVHDVKEIKRALSIIKAIERADKFVLERSL